MTKAKMCQEQVSNILQNELTPICSDFHTQVQLYLKKNFSTWFKQYFIHFKKQNAIVQKS